MEFELAELIREAHEAKLLKLLFREKLKGYSGISHDELRTICAMLEIREEGDAE